MPDKMETLISKFLKVGPKFILIVTLSKYEYCADVIFLVLIIGEGIIIGKIWVMGTEDPIFETSCVSIMISR